MCCSSIAVGKRPCLATRINSKDKVFQAPGGENGDAVGGPLADGMVAAQADFETALAVPQQKYFVKHIGDHGRGGNPDDSP